jgi:hypothetical protein
MSAQGPLTTDQRYVVMLEFPGPKSVVDVQKIGALVADLKEKCGASVKLSIIGLKGAGQ